MALGECTKQTYFTLLLLDKHTSRVVLKVWRVDETIHVLCHRKLGWFMMLGYEPAHFVFWIKKKTIPTQVTENGSSLAVFIRSSPEISSYRPMKAG